MMVLNVCLKSNIVLSINLLAFSPKNWFVKNAQKNSIMILWRQLVWKDRFLVAFFIGTIRMSVLNAKMDFIKIKLMIVWNILLKMLSIANPSPNFMIMFAINVSRIRLRSGTEISVEVSRPKLQTAKFIKQDLLARNARMVMSWPWMLLHVFKLISRIARLN